jgi:hypothetical protein
MDFTTVKYDSAGTQQWARSFNGPADSNDGGIDVALDSSQNVCVTGYSTGSGTLFDMTTIEYTPAGQQLWLRTFDANHAHDAALALALDRDDNVYVTGYATFVGTQSDYATIKYSADGTQRWVESYNGPVTGFDEGQSVTVDREENVYITGYSDGGTGLVNYDYATVKYDSTGAQQWAVRYNGTGDNIDVAVKVALDLENNVIVGGWSTGTNSPDVDFTTIKYEPAGSAAVPPLAAAANHPLWIAASPNPFDGASELRFRLAAPASVDLSLWDLSGRKVRTLIHAAREAGDQSAVLSASGLAPGIYFYRLSAGTQTASGKLVRR